MSVKGQARNWHTRDEHGLTPNDREYLQLAVDELSDEQIAAYFSERGCDVKPVSVRTRLCVLAGQLLPAEYRPSREQLVAYAVKRIGMRKQEVVSAV